MHIGSYCLVVKGSHKRPAENILTNSFLAGKIIMNFSAGVSWYSWMAISLFSIPFAINLVYEVNSNYITYQSVDIMHFAK